MQNQNRLTEEQEQEIVNQHVEKFKRDVLSGKVQLGGQPACVPQPAPLPEPDTVMVEKNGKLSVERVTPQAMQGYKDLEAKGYLRVKMGPNRKERRRANALANKNLGP